MSSYADRKYCAQKEKTQTRGSLSGAADTTLNITTLLIISTPHVQLFAVKK
jgi:hypothetical protein